MATGTFRMVCGDKYKNNIGYWVAQYGLNPTRRNNHGICVDITYVQSCYC